MATSEKTLIYFTVRSVEFGTLIVSGSIEANALADPAVLLYVKRELATHQTPSVLRFYAEEGGKRWQIGVPILLVVDEPLADKLATFATFAGVIRYASG